MENSGSVQGNEEIPGSRGYVDQAFTAAWQKLDPGIEPDFVFFGKKRSGSTLREKIPFSVNNGYSLSEQVPGRDSST